MWDRVLAVVSLGTLVAFASVLIWYIAEPDLIIITIAVLVLAAIDFYLLTFRSPSDKP